MWKSTNKDISLTRVIPKFSVVLLFSMTNVIRTENLKKNIKCNVWIIDGHNLILHDKLFLLQEMDYRMQLGQKKEGKKLISYESKHNRQEISVLQDHECLLP